MNFEGIDVRVLDDEPGEGKNQRWGHQQNIPANRRTQPRSYSIIFTRHIRHDTGKEAAQHPGLL